MAQEAGRPGEDTTPGPIAFREFSVDRVRLIVATDQLQAARRLGLFAPDGLPRAFEGPEGAGGRAPTAILDPGDGASRLLLRRLRHGGLLGPVLRGLYLGLRRARSELTVTAALRAAGAPVPRPALALGRRRLGPIFECAIATCFEEECTDGLAFLEEAPNPARLRCVAEAAGHAVRRFHDAGGRHPDLQIRNLLVREDQTGFTVLVIDLDRARHVSRVGPGARMKELMRLHRSLLKRGVAEQVGARGHAHFFSAYCGDDRELRRALLARLPLERRRLALHRRVWRHEAAAPAPAETPTGGVG